MGTIILGSSANRKGITVNPSEVFFNGSVVSAIMSGVAEIWSSAKPLVPNMTSNTTPSGEVIYSSAYNTTDYPMYYAFDGNNETRGAYTNASGGYVGYKFNTPTCVNKFVCISGGVNETVKLQASNDNSSWTDLSSAFALGVDNTTHEISVNNKNYYLIYRLYQVGKSTGASGTSVRTLQFYGKQLVGLVPTMTSNTSLYGEASASHVFNNAEVYQAYKAFDGNAQTGWCADQLNSWIQYKFQKPTKVKLLSLLNWSDSHYIIKTFKVLASNDGSDWDELGTFTIPQTPSLHNYFSLANNKLYTHYRLLITEKYDAYVDIISLQFYAEKELYEALVPNMTSATTPYGECFEDYHSSNFASWQMFTDDETSQVWFCNSVGHYGGYKFVEPTVVKAFRIKPFWDSGKMLSVKEYRIEASNDNTEWTTLFSETLENVATDKIVNIDNNTRYLYYRIFVVSTYQSNGSVQINRLQFYK